MGVALVKTRKGAKVGFYEEKWAWNWMAGHSVHWNFSLYCGSVAKHWTPEEWYLKGQTWYFVQESKSFDSSNINFWIYMFIYLKLIFYQ